MEVIIPIEITGRLGDGDSNGAQVLRIKRVDKSLPMPSYATDGAWGLDLYARENVALRPGEDDFIPLNVIVQAPPGYGVFLYPRSSIYKHYGLILLNGVGVVDADYIGPNDELMAHVKNVSDKLCRVNAGDRIAQLVIHRAFKFPIVEFEPEGKSRGGHGTTGKRA